MKRVFTLGICQIPAASKVEPQRLCAGLFVRDHLIGRFAVLCWQGATLAEPGNQIRDAMRAH